MMKITSRVILALTLCALTSTAAFAKVKSRTVTFGMDFIVGETTIQKGTYKVLFDDQTNELSIVDKKKTVVAKTAAHVVKRNGSTLGLDMKWADSGANKSLVSIAFPGKGQSVIVGESRAVDVADSN